uniref:Uncharacterized protein n=1 Tax=Morchella brunnea TaxID=1174671 RepID=A0A8K1I7Z6_9PEZI|nr:hypothetical protein LK370_mgp182 [Morchella brunnea]UBU98504.1 hypothetical protein [Morchella brunnea]
MYTRKAIDFKLWRIALLLHKKGYYYLPEGRQLFVDISNNINKFRYSTTPKTDEKSVTLTEILKRSDDIFETNPPFDINSGKSHMELAQAAPLSLFEREGLHPSLSSREKDAFSRADRKLNPNTVYLYKDGQLIEGSPFAGYASGGFPSWCIRIKFK